MKDVFQGQDFWVVYDHYLRIKIFTDKGIKEYSSVGRLQPEAFAVFEDKAGMATLIAGHGRRLGVEDVAAHLISHPVGLQGFYGDLHPMDGNFPLKGNSQVSGQLPVAYFAEAIFPHGTFFDAGEI